MVLEKQTLQNIVNHSLNYSWKKSYEDFLVEKIVKLQKASARRQVRTDQATVKIKLIMLVFSHTTIFIFILFQIRMCMLNLIMLFLI